MTRYRKKHELAIFGGNKIINNSFTSYNPIGYEEVAAAKSVIESGILSKFIGAWGEDFFGGPRVREFEEKCENYFNVKHAITVNSWTSGLISAVGAIDIEPGDEIIVSPFTMCATATSILHWNAIPVFADIEPDFFCLDPASVEANITPHTKAIMTVDIFGQSSDIDALMNIAKKYNLKLITDTAQAPGALYNGHYAGTLSHIGGFSLNYHKHIHTGEGGILVTNDEKIANRLRLIRNHAEAVVGPMGESDLSNMLGYNFRLGEIESAIGICQLDKLRSITKRRQEIANLLNKGLAGLEGLKIPGVRDGGTHVYYIYPIILEINKLGVPRNLIIESLQAEGVTGLLSGYVNVHMLPMYQKKIAYGSGGFPWTSDICKREVNYSKGICPVAEELHESTFIGFAMCLHELSDNDVQLIVKAFRKVWENMTTLRDHYKELDNISSTRD